MINNTQKAFLELVKAGLWGGQSPVQESKSLIVQDSVDWKKVYQLAQEQSVQGLVLQGAEWLRNHKVKFTIPQVLLLQWIGEVQVIEQRNKAMNAFIAEIIAALRDQDIFALLLKGQGVAQCYERPLWRSCGDIDFFFSMEDYIKAKVYLPTLASSFRAEGDTGNHLELTIGQWIVEMHGDLGNGLSYRMDKVLKEIQDTIIFKGGVRSWVNGDTQVFLPASTEDVIFVFTHIIKHLFMGGIGLRQICDWSRLLWCYHTELDLRYLETKIRQAKLMSEWRVFAALVVKHLGMPQEAMPFYSTSNKWKKRSSRLLSYIIYAGNFGHNKDISYQLKYKGITRKFISFVNQVKDSVKLSMIFPLDAIRFLLSYTVLKTRKSLSKG